jgi:hypothetical protein
MLFVSIPIEILFLILWRLNQKDILHLKATSRGYRNIIDEKFGVSVRPKRPSPSGWNFKIRRITARCTAQNEWNKILELVQKHRVEKILISNIIGERSIGTICETIESVVIQSYPTKVDMSNSRCTYTQRVCNAFPNMKKIKVCIASQCFGSDIWPSIFKDLGKLKKLHTLNIVCCWDLPSIEICKLGYESLRTINMTVYTHSVANIVNLLNGSQVTTMSLKIMLDTESDWTVYFKVQNISPLKNITIATHYNTLDYHAKVDVEKDLEYLSFDKIKLIELNINSKIIRTIKMIQIEKLYISGSDARIGTLCRVVAHNEQVNISRDIKILEYAICLEINSLVSHHSFLFGNATSVKILCHKLQLDDPPTKPQCQTLLNMIGSIIVRTEPKYFPKMVVLMRDLKMTLLELFKLAHPFKIRCVTTIIPETSGMDFSY